MTKHVYDMIKDMRDYNDKDLEEFLLNKYNKLSMYTYLSYFS